MRAAPRRALATLAGAAVSAGVLWWLVSRADGAALAAAISRAQTWPLLLGVALFPLIQWLRGWRFAVMLTGRLAPPGWPMFRVAAELIVLAFLLPFKLGELSFPLLMKRSFGTEVRNRSNWVSCERCSYSS